MWYYIFQAPPNFWGTYPKCNLHFWRCWLYGFFHVFSQNVSCIFEGFTYPKCKLHFGEVPPAKTARIFLPQFFAISFKTYPVLAVPNSDRVPSLSAGHLSIWQEWASTLRVLRLHRSTSDLPFQVQCFFCLLRRFYYLVQVNLLLWCVLHLAFPLFPGCISSVYILHISCRLLPTCIGSFHVFFICQMCPFPSCICSLYFSSICNFGSFQLAFCFPIFLQLSCVPLSDLHFPIPFSWHCFISPFFKM